MRLLDLFSGIGGFSLAAQWVWGDELEIVAFCEIDKYCRQILKKNWKNVEIIQDVRQANGNEFKDLFCITFGFPCQDLSIAGKRGGLRSSRSGLFFEAMRIVRDAKPRYFIFENVTGLFSKANARNKYERREWFLTVLREIAESGYDGQWQILNTRWFLPQNRERIYFVGYPRNECKSQIFPIGESIQGDNGTQKETFEEGTWVRRNYPCLRVGGGNTKGLISLDTRTGNTARGQHFIADSLHGFGHGWQGYHDRKFAIADSLQERDYKEGQLIQVTPLKYLDMNQKNFPEERMQCLDGMQTWGIKIGSNIRRLTPVECERLQGFPDNWTEGVSDSQRYKMLGNAVSIPPTYQIFKAIKEMEI